MAESKETIVVAPFVGAWIEINCINAAGTCSDVAPFVGAWIEIRRQRRSMTSISVAPFVGAWIEIVCPVLTV